MQRVFRAKRTDLHEKYDYPNLQRGLAYQQAYDRFAPFDRLQAPDPGTRAAVARVVAATLDAGHRAFVTINNKAEGSAPLSVVELARVLAA